MESLLFAFGAVAPIIITVAIGYLLKRIGFMNAAFSTAANKLVFRIFLPAMLFLNIYNMDVGGGLRIGYIGYVCIMLLIIYLLSLPLTLVLTRDGGRRGALLQGIFRSNYALIGLPLAAALFGSEGVAVASLLSAVVIPIFNILAVISLSVFRSEGGRVSVKRIFLDIAKNPLILSIAVALAILGVRHILEAYGIGFRLSDITVLYTVLDYLGDMATPLALLVLGAQFQFSAVASLKREIIFGTLMRTVVVPLLGVGVAYLFFRDSFNGAHFAAFVAVFTTPVAVSSVPMAQEMKSDAVLAGQLVVWTTLFAGFTVFIASFLLKSAGIF